MNETPHGSEGGQDHWPHAQSPVSPPPPQAPYETAPGRPHRGPLVLTLGIIGATCSLLGCGCCIAFVPLGAVPGVLAWIFAHGDIAAMDQGHMDRRGRGLTQAGQVLGIISVVLAAVGILVFIASLVRGFAMPAGTGTSSWSIP